MQRIACLIISTLMMTSCAGYNEAYDDRVCYSPNSKVPLQCNEVFVEFKCERTIPVLVSSEKKGKISIRLKRDFESPKAGELFSQYGGIPIFVGNGSPWKRLSEDVANMLRQAGYQVDSRSESAGDVIELDIKLLDVRSKDAGWSSLKGETSAIATFTVTFIRNEAVVWVEEFSGQDQDKFQYFLLSDSQRLLNSAYCSSLEKFSNRASMPDFLSGR